MLQWWQSSQNACTLLHINIHITLPKDIVVSLSVNIMIMYEYLLMKNDPIQIFNSMMNLENHAQSASLFSHALNL